MSINHGIGAKIVTGKETTMKTYDTFYRLEDVKVGDEVYAVLNGGAKVTAKAVEIFPETGAELDLSGHHLWVGKEEFVLAKRHLRRMPEIGQYGYMTVPSHGRLFGQVRGNPRWTNNEPLQFIYVHEGYGHMEEITSDHDFTPVDIPADPGA